MITLKNGTSEFMIYKTSLRVIPSGVTYMVKNDISAKEYNLNVLMVTELLNSYKVQYSGSGLKEGHYHLLIKDGAQIIYTEKVYIVL